MAAKSGRLFALAVVTLLFSSFAHAASQRAFVSAGRLDNPSCSLATPCRNFAAAIAAIVSGGEVIVLDSAGYGPVTIMKAASIIAPPGVCAGVSVSTGNGVTINAPGQDVVLRGLAINGLGGNTGIFVQQARRVRIENCVVSRMSSMGIFDQGTGAVTVSDTIVRDNAADGIGMVTSVGSITLERVTSEGNLGSGIYISPNLSNGQLDATISDSAFSRNGTNGIWVDAGASSGAWVSVDRSTFSENIGSGVLAQSSTSAVVRVTVQRSTLRRNGRGIRALGDLPSSVELNLSENVLHYNASNGIIVDGAGTSAWVSGNSYDKIGCQNGGSIFTYRNNSVTALTALCAATWDLQ